jgi:hypothetical protein
VIFDIGLLDFGHGFSFVGFRSLVLECFFWQVWLLIVIPTLVAKFSKWIYMDWWHYCMELMLMLVNTNKLKDYIMVCM